MMNNGDRLSWITGYMAIMLVLLVILLEVRAQHDEIIDRLDMIEQRIGGAE